MDKFRKTFPIAVTFADGEQPPAAKLNALGSQSRNGLAIVEKALGDLWNQSGDSNLIPTGDLFKNALYVNNIGRALGQQSMVAPRIPSLPLIEKYFDTIISSGGIAKPENWLRYQPVPAGGSLVSGDFTVGTTNPAGTPMVTYVTSPDLVDANGKWHVTENGKLITFIPILTAELTYKPAPVPDIDTTATATVIPDPFTDTGLGTEFNGLKVAFANDTDSDDGYWIYLPPRRPLLSDRKIAQSPDYTGNAVDPTGPDRYFFQGTAFDASSDAHYRYRFPDEIQDIIDLASPVALPDNFMYLMDTETGTIIEGVVFSVDNTAPAYVVKAVGTKLNEITIDATLVTLQADEDPSAYKDRFKLMCPGTSLARAHAGLSKQYANHTHIGADGSLPLSHSQLLDLYNSNSPNWEPSALKGDDHPQYLHRDGMNAGRDSLLNGLRGDLLLLQGDNTVAITADSYRIRFGNSSNQSLYWDLSSNAVAVGGGNFNVEAGNSNVTGGNFNVISAGKKIVFESSATAYIDKTRAQAYYDAGSLVKCIEADDAGPSNIAAAAYAQIGTCSVAVSIPASLSCVIKVEATVNWDNTTAGTTSSFKIKFGGVDWVIYTAAEATGVVDGPNTTHFSTSRSVSGGFSSTITLNGKTTAGTLTFARASLIVTLYPSF